MFDRRLKKINHSELYNLLLKMVLLKAENFDMRDDYCQLRDDRNDGWDVFYFGPANEKEVIEEKIIVKPCYVQSVNKGSHGEHRIYFTDEDSIKIIETIKMSSNEFKSIRLAID